jgi:hypothetical protein
MPCSDKARVVPGSLDGMGLEVKKYNGPARVLFSLRWPSLCTVPPGFPHEVSGGIQSS